MVSCQEKEDQETEKKDNIYSFFVGTYTGEESQGIYKYSINQEGALKRIGLASVSNNPSFLTKSLDGKHLIAVKEIDEEGVGSVESFVIMDDSLALISKSSSGGANPCFITINEAGYILVANYTGGNVGLLKLNEKGELTDLMDVQQHSGSGGSDRQEAPHAHSAWFDGETSEVISVDLGSNELWFSHLDTNLQKLIPNDPYTLKMAPQAGPRHLTFFPNGRWIYIINELESKVALIEKVSAGKYKAIADISTLPNDYSEANLCADIHISMDGKFVYASNRGHNSIAIFSVNPNDGTLNWLGNQAVKGNWPRNFSLTPDEKYLLVANQHSNNIVAFKRNSATGLLEYVNEIEAPTPVCILF